MNSKKEGQHIKKKRKDLHVLFRQLLLAAAQVFIHVRLKIIHHESPQDEHTYTSVKNMLGRPTIISHVLNRFYLVINLV